MSIQNDLSDSDKNLIVDFVVLVREMRSAQKAYFKSRRQSDLEICKRVEKKVDEQIHVILDQQRAAWQDKLI